MYGIIQLGMQVNRMKGGECEHEKDVKGEKFEGKGEVKMLPDEGDRSVEMANRKRSNK